MKKTLMQRFVEKVRLPGPNDLDGCWIWQGARDGHGYSSFQGHAKKILAAHRFSYEAFIGPVPRGLAIDHLCREPLCVNPGHLEAVTFRENLMRGNTLTRMNAEKVACVHGHPYTPENTYRCPKGWRRCRACAKQAQSA